MAEDFVLDIDWNISKAEAKQKKLSREFEESKAKAANIKKEMADTADNIQKSTEKLKLLKSELEEISKSNLKKSLDGTIKKSDLNNYTKKRAEIEKENELLKKQESVYAKQELSLQKQISKTADIGNQIALNSKKTSKFSEAFKKSEKSIERFGKRLKSLIASALFFSLVTKAFTSLREEFGKMINEAGTKTAKLASQLKGNLAVIGNILYQSAKPAIEFILQALVKITNLLANAIARLLGKDIEEMKKLGTATKKTGEEAKKATAGFDTLQTIDTSSNSSGSSDEGIDTSGITKLDGDLDEVDKKLKDILWKVGEIGLGLLAWKISSKFLGSLGGLVFSASAILLINNIKTQIEEGLDWKNLLIGGLVGGLTGGAIGAKLGGVGGAIIGFTLGASITFLIKSIIATGDEKSDTSAVIGGYVMSGLLAVGTVLGIIKKFSKKHKASDVTKSVDAASETVNATSKGTSKLTGTLKSLVKNLALGIVVLAEVAVAVGLFLAAIWGFGLLLQQIVKAWQPVLDKGETAATAIGLGSALLVVVGAACAGIGYLTIATGGTIAAAIAIGTAVLAEISIATDLFVIEIAAIGLLLQQVIKAWQPVLDNGETVKEAISLGSELLLEIGTVTALLGGLSIASVGLLPVAIGLGTAMLGELTWALIEFIDNLVKVANSMTYDLYPPLIALNSVLPDLAEKMKNYVKYMKVFAEHVVSYTKSSAISGFSATVDSIVKFFTSDPIKSLSNDAKKQYGQSKTLNANLENANPALEKSITLMKRYYELLKELSKQSGKINNVSFTTGISKAIGNLTGNIGNFFKNLFGIQRMSGDIPVAVNGVSAIPRLSTGIILPGGSPMLAYVNDQPKGKPYLEGSIENIAVAFDKYLGNKGIGNQNITIEATGSMAQLIRYLNLEIKQENKRASMWG